MSKIINQHYVPQFYLRNFSNNGENIWVYDKFNNNKFHPNVKNVACERFFYDVSDIDSAAGVDQFMEKYFYPLEESTKTVIDEICESIKRKNFSRLNSEQRISLAQYIALQYMRTKESRNRIIELYEKFIEESFRNYIKLKNSDLADAKFEIGIKKTMEATLHSTALLDYDHLQTISHIIYNHIWVLFENSTPIPLYTSDHPIVKHNHPKQPIRIRYGFGSGGIEIAFPISPSCMISIFERKSYEKLRSFDGTLFIIKDPENIIYYNSLQVKDSYKYIFSIQPDFDLAASMCKEQPELCDPDRKRVVVETLSNDIKIRIVR